jgi:hypothetical protein
MTKPNLSTAVTTTVESTVDIIPELRAALDIELGLYANLSAQIKHLESQKSAVVENIEAIRADIGADKLDLDTGFKVTRVTGSTTSKLDPKLLMSRGVKQSVIEECTVITPRKDYTLVTVPGVKGRKSDD